MRKLSPDIQKKLILSVGIHRSERPFSPVEVADAIQEELEAGTTPQELASVCHLESSTMILRFRRLLRLNPSIRHLVDWGNSPTSISFSVASHIARLNDNNDQEAVVKTVLEYRLTSLEVQEIVQVVDRAGASVGEAIETVLRLRPRVEKYHLFIGAVLSEQLRSCLRQMPQPERDRFFKMVVEKHLPGLCSWGGRLGCDRFSVIVGEEVATVISSLPGGFEKSINTFLELEALKK